MVPDFPPIVPFRPRESRVAIMPPETGSFPPALLDRALEGRDTRSPLHAEDRDMFEVLCISFAFFPGLGVRRIGLPPLVGFLAAGMKAGCPAH